MPTPPYPYYGPPQQPYPYPYQQAPPTNALAITSFVIGIVAILLSWIPVFDVILGAPAFILGVLGISRANHTGGAGRGFAITGPGLEAVSMVVSILVLVIVLATRPQ
jgi:hypothetical protein